MRKEVFADGYVINNGACLPILHAVYIQRVFALLLFIWQCIEDAAARCINGEIIAAEQCFGSSGGYIIPHKLFLIVVDRVEIEIIAAAVDIGFYLSLSDSFVML